MGKSKKHSALQIWLGTGMLILGVIMATGCGQKDPEKGADGTEQTVAEGETQETDKTESGAASGSVSEEQLPVFDVSSTSLEDGNWLTETGAKHENRSPQLSWDAIDGADRYVVLMLDKDAGNWLHWFEIVSQTELEAGMFSGKENGYVGPYPPETHEYDVYVIALAGEPEKSSFLLDTTGDSIRDKLTMLNTAKDGSVGNVLSYGVVKGLYTP
ncbi:MAG: hypothetical protein K5739_01215 [Lachnospiraceae bacterium]|nr:hypothetical protein [Lachnospiraceae bacterium]